MKKLVQLKNKENEKLDPINKNYEQRIEKIENDISFLNGTVLYNNTNGSMGNISLSDSIENYKYIDILFKDDQNIYNTARFIVKNGAWYSLQSFQYVKADSRIVMRGKNIQLIDKTIKNGDYCAIALTSSGNNFYWNNNIFITKIIGYK